MEKRREMLEQLGERAKKASRILNRLGVRKKNEGLEAVAEALVANADKLLQANQLDVQTPQTALLKRLTISSMKPDFTMMTSIVSSCIICRTMYVEVKVDQIFLLNILAERRETQWLV